MKRILITLIITFTVASASVAENAKVLQAMQEIKEREQRMAKIDDFKLQYCESISSQEGPVTDDEYDIYSRERTRSL